MTAWISGTKCHSDCQRPLVLSHYVTVRRLGNAGKFFWTLTLDRHRLSPKFSERDRAILEILQPHLSNIL
ncbi:MAG: hypothetical protein ACM3X9_03945 [Bacillota bacterium]